MKTNNSIIIRLIDVVFILLMGFLLISDIVHKNQIKLPSRARSKSTSEQKPQIVPLDIRIVPSDTVLAEIDPETETSLIELCQLKSYYRVTENEKTHKFRILDKLEEYLIKTKIDYEAGGNKVVVIINPDPESMVQATINLIDICRKYGLKRNFKYYESS
ncbi:hypothetical protein GF337_11790 [candidate division KSB1 bacterium]|nr:hypothetical protein [candidate division KSB1 bacterium]